MTTMRTYEQAGEELNIPASWLEKNKHLLPHTEFGPRHIRFSDAQMDEIREMHARRPLGGDAPPVSIPGVLIDLTPAGPKRHRSRSGA